LRESGWVEHLKHVVRQQPLIATRPSLAQVGRVPAMRRPRAVFCGVGLSSGRQLGAGVPLDVLGMLVPAERLRQAIDAETLLVLIADEHARHVVGDPQHVDGCADDWVDLLQRLRRSFGLRHLRIVRASDFHHRTGYRSVLDGVKQRAGQQADPYFVRQAADVAFLHRQLGGLLKVGWTLQNVSAPRTSRDEAAFDRELHRWVNDDVPVVYCRAGRVLSDQRPKAPPYLVIEPARRLCLDPHEQPVSKLRWADLDVSPDTARAVRRHLKAIARAVRQTLMPLSGPLERQIETLLGRLYQDVRVEQLLIPGRNSPWECEPPVEAPLHGDAGACS